MRSAAEFSCNAKCGRLPTAKSIYLGSYQAVLMIAIISRAIDGNLTLQTSKGRFAAHSEPGHRVQADRMSNREDRRWKQAKRLAICNATPSTVASCQVYRNHSVRERQMREGRGGRVSRTAKVAAMSEREIISRCR